MAHSVKRDNMRLLTVLLTFLIVLTACAAPAQPTIVESQDVVIDGTFETSLLVTQSKGASEGNVLFPLDPASGTALPGYTPIPLGQSFFHAFSPDRRTLAVVSFPSDYIYSGSLLFIDLVDWSTRRFDLELSGGVSTMVFSPDGKQLAIAHGETHYKLTMIDVETGVITAQSQMDSFVTHLKFAESGDALMLYGPSPYTSTEVSAGPPRVLLLDTADLSPRWSAELENVHEGIFPKNEDVTPENIYEPGQAFYLSPGLAFAPAGDALYIVHADSEQLTTVDFENQKVETVDIQTKLTWFERYLSITAGIAHAKIGEGVTRQVAISPDGQFLYVVGVNSSTFQDQSGNWDIEQSALGLEIIQTSDGSRVEHFETESTEMSLSPDGHFLYLRQWGKDPPLTEVFELTNQRVVAHKAGVFAMPVLLMNGKYLLASTYSTSETMYRMTILQPDDLSLLTEWTDSQSVWSLTTP